MTPAALAWIAVAAATTTQVPTTTPAPVSTLPDRSKPPPVATPVLMDYPAPVQVTLEGGVPALVWPIEGADDVVVRVVLHRGSYGLVGTDTEVTSALDDQWAVATTSLDPGELAARTSTDDLDLWVAVHHDDTVAHLKAPQDQLASAVGLLADVVLRPAFPNAELKRYQRDRRWYLESEAPADIEAALAYATSHAWYDPSGPYGDRPDLTALKRVRRADLVALHQRLLAEAPATVLVTGDVDPATIPALLAPLARGLRASGERDRAQPASPPASPVLVVVEVPGATQAAIGVTLPAPPLFHDDASAFSAVSFALGEHFLARLNANLREENGWTYGIYGSWSADQASGTWSADCIVSAENAAEALTEVRRELDRVVAEGVTDAELGALWTDRAAAYNTARRGAQEAAGLLYGLLARDESLPAFRARREALRAVTPAQAAQAAAGWFGASAPLQLVMAGDPAALASEIDALGLPVLRVSAADAVFGRLPGRFADGAGGGER